METVRFSVQLGRMCGKHPFLRKKTSPAVSFVSFLQEKKSSPPSFLFRRKENVPPSFSIYANKQSKTHGHMQTVRFGRCCVLSKKRRKASAFRALPGARRPRWADPAECSAVFRDHPRPVPDGRRTGLAPYSFRAHRRGSPPGSARASRRSRTEYGPGARSYAVSPVRTGIAGSAVASAACSFDSAASASADPVGSRCCCRTSVLLLSLSLGSRRALADRLA